MIDQTVVVGPFQCNCRILACPETGEAILVDPGDEPDKILKALHQLQTPQGKPLTVRALFHTHAHLDHIGGTRAVKQGLLQEGVPETSPEILLHAADHELYLNLKMQGEMFGFSYEDPRPVDRFVEDTEEFQVGTLRFQVLHTPGHSPGSVCLRLNEDQRVGSCESLFAGDTLFQNSVGRTDLWGGDSDQLIKNIKQRIFTLDDDTRVCPGHGPETTVGLEKRSNPFLQ